MKTTIKHTTILYLYIIFLTCVLVFAGFNIIKLEDKNFDLYYENFKFKQELKQELRNSYLLNRSLERYKNLSSELEDMIYNLSSLNRELALEYNRLELEFELYKSRVPESNTNQFERWTYNSTGELYYNDLWRIVRARDYQILDVNYKLYPLELIQEEVKQITRTLPTYELDFYDCVDYSFEMKVEMRKRFKGLPIGILIVSNSEESHAVNIIIDDELNIWYLEPQLSKFILLEEFRKYTRYSRIDKIIL